MYMEWPFQIFQTRDHVAMTFEWQQNHRLIDTNGSAPPEGLEFWMGDSRGRWEGDTLVVDVAQFNGNTWFDMAGNFHSNALHVVERYTPIGPDTLQYEVTMEDPQVFTRPWTIRMVLQRQKDVGLLDYECTAMLDELGPGAAVTVELLSDPEIADLHGQAFAEEAGRAGRRRLEQLTVPIDDRLVRTARECQNERHRRQSQYGEHSVASH